MMNKLVTTTLATSLCLSAAALFASDSLQLEPCANGDVSASGTHPTQAAEDRYRWYVVARQEPCMNGDVPPGGVLADLALGNQPAIGDRDPSQR
jgi:hypothetical protein